MVQHDGSRTQGRQVLSIRQAFIAHTVKYCMVIVLAVFGFGLASVSPPANAIWGDVDGWYEIKTSNGLCLDNADNARWNGAPVIQWACTGANNQKWYTQYISQYYPFQPICAANPDPDWFKECFRIWNGVSGNCLDVSGNSPYNGTKIIQWPCNNNGVEAQTWLIKGNSNGSKTLVGKTRNGWLNGPRACLDVPNNTNQTYPYVQLQIWDCTFRYPQQFYIRFVLH